MTPEPELVARAAAGSRTAFAALVEPLWPDLVRLARSVAGDEEAEDAVQEGLLQAWRRLPALRASHAFAAWLRRIVVRRSLRRARRVRFCSLEAVPEGSRSASTAPGFDVPRALARLAPRQRAVMHLTLIEGMTDREIGASMGITPASVRAHRRRARSRLRHLLNGDRP